MNVESELIPYHAVRALGTGPVLVLAPHPDDEIFGCAGAIMRHLAAGDPITVIVLTDGGGTWADGPERDAYVALRREESRTAANILGYGEPVFWEYRDRALRCEEPLIQRLLAATTGFRWLYAPSPHEIHPDHRALGLATLEVIRRSNATVSAAFYEIGAPLPPNRLLDISDLLDRKRRAIACFAGQLVAQAYDRHVEALNRYRTYTLPREVEAAEAYWVVSRDEAERELSILRAALARQRQFSGWPELLPISEPTKSPIDPHLENDDLRRQLEQARARARELQTQLENEHRKWQLRLDQLTSSRSWRLTAPLRIVANWLRTRHDRPPGRCR